MASHGSLPLYYRNSKPTGLPGPTKSWKDNYLLVVVFVGFIILIAGTFWFLPPLEDKDADYEKTYGRFTGNPSSYITDPAIPSEPTLEPPEATEKDEGRGRKKGWKGVGVGMAEEERLHRHGEREEEGGSKVEFEKNVKPPIRLESLIGDEDRERKVEIFEKHQSDPPREEKSPPDTDNPPDANNPPEWAVENNEGDSDAAAAVNGVEHVDTPTDEAKEQVQDIVTEERRRKVVEVSCWFAGLRGVGEFKFMSDAVRNVHILVPQGFHCSTVGSRIVLE